MIESSQAPFFDASKKCGLKELPAKELPIDGGIALPSVIFGLRGSALGGNASAAVRDALRALRVRLQQQESRGLCGTDRCHNLAIA